MIDVGKLKDITNEIFVESEPWQIALTCCGSTILVVYSLKLFLNIENILDQCKLLLFQAVRKIPMVSKKINAEKSKTEALIIENFDKKIGDQSYMTVLPDRGIPSSDVLKLAEEYNTLGDKIWENGRVSGAVYIEDSDLIQLENKIYSLTSLYNLLHPELFPGGRKMEAEVVKMCCNLFHGGKNSCGCMTLGGTESIMLACLAYRNYARDVKGTKSPEMIIPVSAHAAFDKAAAMFGIKVRHVALDEITWEVDIRKMEKCITQNTCMLVASAPGFPHGIVDPVSKVAKLGLKYNIPVHVDACLGGFIIAFLEDAGIQMQPFDFRVDGVTSISCDTHKYGCSPKGSSVLMYSDQKYMRKQYSIQPNWPGGLYASPTLSGSRPGAIVASTWAAMLYFGKLGYVENARKLSETTKALASEMKKIKGIKVLGNPEICVVAFTSSSFDIYRVFEKMVEKDWHLSALQFPSALHLAVTMFHTHSKIQQQLIADLRSVVDVVSQDPLSAKASGAAAIYGMSQQIPDRSIVSEMAEIYLDNLYHVKENEVDTNKRV